MDLFMSSAGDWSSDLYGLYMLVGGFACATAALAMAMFASQPRVSTTPEHTSAVGRVMLTAVSLWGYLMLASVLLTWIADLPREASFYVERTTGSWRPVFFSLLLGHFVVPFLLLLPREAKRRHGYVAMVGAWLVCMHGFDNYWWVVPSAMPNPSVFDFGPTVFFGGVGTAVANLRYRRHMPQPSMDAELRRGLAYEAR
jgi:hypothetical protein